ncbi:hypothetical protein RISK_001608 [Rhodopirellula islandica]|uniref:Uncharacterized protein n=1 Tax=Rhodopirellula islandica TaxID=595434 RepID=A0A0J1BIP3_RHOIS|nr:hypothetical protein RISK_001608 [Rhodopirellula islandica]
MPSRHHLLPEVVTEIVSREGVGCTSLYLLKSAVCSVGPVDLLCQIET